jgi:uncharacterized membrane protein YjdF
MDRTLKIARLVAMLLLVGALVYVARPFEFYALCYALLVFKVVFRLVRRVLPHVTRA